MDCRGEHCKASCTRGRCTLKCPANTKTCNLRCTVGPCETIRLPRTELTTVTPTNPQPTTPRNPSTTFQTCAKPQGGCRLTCPTRPTNSSCVRNCNRGKCQLRCYPEEKCIMTCIRGNCKPVICTSKSCLLYCPGGNCAMNCLGTLCRTSCLRGGCSLSCSQSAKTCKLRGAFCRPRCAGKRCRCTRRRG